MNVTQWFPMREMPINDGVYELLRKQGPSIGHRWSMFKNGVWMETFPTREEAARTERQSFDAYCSQWVFAWRGLAEKPE